jgi:hypothetical protein
MRRVGFVHSSASLLATMLLASALPASGLQPCPSGDTSCAMVSVNGNSVTAGNEATVRVRFAQGQGEMNGEGSDEVAAIAFSIGIPGCGPEDDREVCNGPSAPLRFSAAGCQDTDGDALPDGVVVGAAIRDRFRVVVENAECEGGVCGCGPNRDRCLCPGDGQGLQDFVNVVVFGPRVLPEGGPVEIPVLPANEELLSLRLQVAPGTAQGDIPIHVFAETDESSMKPQFAANCSIGDQAAIDQTADRPNDLSKVRFQDGVVTVLPPLESCAGDCDRDMVVELGEIITSVNIALDKLPLLACSEIDRNENGAVGIDELIMAVDKSMTECP